MPQSSPQVLLVDDDAGMVRLLTHWIETAGFRVRSVCDGRAAMAAIEAECPQFLVTDWEMPHVSGRELCAWVRKQSLPSYVYTVLLTARSGADDMVQGLEAGADEFVRKPVNKEELLARMRAGLRVLELESRLSRAAKCDSLTGLFTQRTLFEHLNHEWTRAARIGAPLSCAMLDIDFFKRINDTFGHSVGDEVIRRVAKVVEGSLRASDVVSRYGGEEFCVLLPETTEVQAVRWAERVRAALAAATVEAGEKRVHVTVSFGVAQRLEETATPEELVDMADQALRVSKRMGRDRVTAFQAMHDAAELRAAEPRAAVFEGLRACDVMTTIVAGLHQTEKVGRAVDYFLQLRINSAPVVDDAGRLVGVLSDKDAMAILLWPHWWETTIADVMKKSVVTYEQDTPALAVYEFLCRVSLRSVVVVHEGRPVGVISRASLLRWFTNALIARGETGDWCGMAPRPASPAEGRRKLAAILSQLGDHTQGLQRRLAVAPADDLAPSLVGGASRMQELINDLLGYSRFVGANAAPACDPGAPATG